jgi:hypothetical protein
VSAPFVRIVATDGKAYCPAATSEAAPSLGVAATLPLNLDEAFAAILADDRKAFDEAMAKFEADLAGVGK